MKPYFILAFCFAFIFALTPPPASAQEVRDELSLPMGDMTLTAPPDSNPTLSPVAFDHSLHFQFSCKSCHHEWDQVSPVQGCATSGCHEKLWPSPPGAKPSSEKRVKSLSGAYHKACRDCHRDIQKANEAQAQQGETLIQATGPIACGECHPAAHSPVENNLTSLSVPLGTITLEAPEGVYAKRPPVEFPHNLHFDFSCQTCHHDWDGTTGIENCTASGCHDQLEPDEKTRNINDPKNVQYYLAAYHKACIQCHRDLVKERKILEKTASFDSSMLPASGPVVCAQCHIKN